MCGIIAYVGARDVQPLLLDSLSRLEYRGYDSAGIAVHAGGGLDVRKKAGRITELVKLVVKNPVRSSSGIGHTRWATHGEPVDVNAHPHLDQTGNLALIHNGVIENYQELKQSLVAAGHAFKSATDTEVLAHLVGDRYEKLADLAGAERLAAAVKAALGEVEGAYGIAVIHKDLPGVIVGARRSSPLVVGIGEHEHFLGSDAAALAPYTQKVIYLKDFDIVTISPGGFNIDTLGEREASYEIKHLDIKPEAAEKGAYPHYMLKEICEQPTAIRNAIRGRLDKDACTAQLGGLNLTNEQLRDIRRVIILGCGTALYSGMVGEHLLETAAYLPAEADFASEFRYRNTPLDNDTLFFAVSQSGETADTIGALREAKRKGHRVLGICNNIGSTIARESDGGVYMHAGPEIGVAATKSFTAQTAIFALLALKLGRMRHLSAAAGNEIINALEQLPAQIETVIAQSDAIKKVAAKYAGAKSMLFFGRQGNYPVALEAALKMKEITYIHAAGHPSSELKHGIIAMIDPGVPSIVIAPQDSMFDKNMNNIREIKARRGPVICLTTEGNHRLDDDLDDVIRVPQTIELLQPILNVVPLQLLAYYAAVALGRDVDKPRNLAKSVTVE